MGGSCNVGLMYYYEDNTCSDIFLKVIHHLLKDKEVLDTMKYALDIDGEEWVEENNIKPDFRTIQMFIESYYGEIVINQALFFTRHLDITLTIEKIDNYFAILLSLQEEDLIPKFSIECLEEASTLVTAFVNQMFNSRRFTFAFCDHDAEVSYPLDESKYSLVLIPDKDGKQLKVTKNAWHINGLTLR